MTSKAALGAMTYPSFSAYRTANLMSQFWTIWAFCILQNTPSLFCISLFACRRLSTSTLLASTCGLEFGDDHFILFYLPRGSPHRTAP